MFNTRNLLRTSLSLIALSALQACTLVTGAGDYEVDPVREQQEIDKVLMKEVRDLDYTMFKLSDFHPGSPLDVAVVDSDHVIQARARIMLIAQPDNKSIPEKLHLDLALTPGPQSVYFFVDSTQNYVVDGTKNQIVDHIWIKPLNADGSGEFTHSTMFQFFNEKSFTILNGSVILHFPRVPVNITKAERDCVDNFIDNLFKKTFEVKIYLDDEDRQVGLFKTYDARVRPQDEQIKLIGILDGGNKYRIQTVFDGNVKNEITVKAPEVGNIELQADKWMPKMFTVASCFKPGRLIP